LKEPGETICCGAEGASKNSQAKGPALDETLESASTKEAIPAGENLSGKTQRQRIHFFASFYL